ncbi:hypothetical protein Ait01nite_012580 [Actinoplanes italicus]|uniref:hypothetical protein n=1 Tax=Actinoplanes italicus TaxID=113567 RepID=UPI000D067DE5|nr:hypothetical protein [Actinoplanes italicus]GIE28213.1 hypothetical protein Ait01nite_012580 [Actinoplanes italicus]
MQAGPVVQPWVVDPVPVLPATPVRVEWPSGGLDPFDVADRRTQWLMFSSGFTRAWPASEGMQPSRDPRRPVDVIPSGYTGVSLLEKLAVVHRGRLVAEWPRAAVGRSDAPRRSPVFSVQFQSTVDVWRAREPRWLEAARAGGEPGGSGLGALSVGGRFDYGSTLDLAMALSVVVGDEPLMVVELLDSWSWH